jgi:hypothetical protein
LQFNAYSIKKIKEKAISKDKERKRYFAIKEYYKKKRTPTHTRKKKD